MTKLNLKKEDGFTLVELLLTVTITGMVFLIAMSIFAPNLSLYLRASDEAKVHSELNIINRKIHDELINTTSVQLLSTVPNSFQSGFDYYYLNNNNKLVKVDSSGSSNVLHANLEFNTFEISLFKRSGDNQNYVTVSMDAALENADHDMEFDILLNNINDTDESDPNVNYIGIKYK